MATVAESVEQPAESERAPYSPALIPLHQGWLTSWLVSVESEMDPEDYHAGWKHVHADARGRTVELDAEVYSPAEARNLAMALLQAADHAESYAYTVMGVLDGERPNGYPAWPGATTEQTRAVHKWIEHAHDRAAAHTRRGQANAEEAANA